MLLTPLRSPTRRRVRSLQLEVQVISHKIADTTQSDFPPGSGKPPWAGHIPVLDALRGIAILLVMLMHFSSLQTPSSAAGKFAHHVIGVGWVGVDLFFVLSGFLITGILVDSRGSNHFFGNFYARRTLRIFPLYYGYIFFLLLIGIPALKHTGVWGNMAVVKEVVSNQAYLWLYATNVLLWLKGHFITGFIDHFWSLSIEEHFYFLWPLLVYILPRKHLMPACVFLILTAIGARIVFFYFLHQPLATLLFTPCRLDSLVVGGAAAIWVRTHSEKSSSRAWITALTIISGAPVIACFCFGSTLPWLDTAYTIIGRTLTAMFFVFILLLVVRWPASATARILNRKWLRFLGKYSYGLYVFHQPLWLLHRRLLPPARLARFLPGGTILWTVDILIPLVVSIGVALLSWHAYEKHFLKLKRYFDYEFKKQPETSPPARHRVERTGDGEQLAHIGLSASLGEE